jgi:5-(aminomethyl)-3-furanmethanol phosphate kinase
MSVVVIKLGGSVLRRPHVAAIVHEVIHSFPAAKPLLVIGGGPAADLVRTWQPLHGLSNHDAHWVAISALKLTAILLGKLVENVVLVSSLHEAKAAWDACKTPVVDVESCLLAAEASQSETLPHSWDVTSDSIAAWIAVEWKLETLCLVKSASLPPNCWLADATRADLVDPYFAGIAGQLKRVYWAHASNRSTMQGPVEQKPAIQLTQWLEWGVPQT